VVFGININAMTGVHQKTAEVGDVCLGAPSRRVDPLEIQGKVHRFRLPG
jgi:hypothetical protein